jgi:hypothetical protein
MDNKKGGLRHRIGIATTTTRDQAHDDVEKLLHRLRENPHDEELRNQVHDVFSKNPKIVLNVAKQGRKTWKNCIGNQVCHPVLIRQAKSLQDLENVVKEARERQLTVRAVGSGHAFSDVALTKGILLETKKMSKVLPIDSTYLKDPTLVAKGSTTLLSVESGITIERLNRELDKRGLALPNMGAYDGQTIAGAISTGTHGTGAGLGPIASYVASLTLVSASGTIYQIEPTHGITDPAAFHKKHPNITLKQDDDWFQSIVISMGCMGIIYSYILKVIPAFYLMESRTLDVWENYRSRFNDHPPGEFPTFVTAHRHYEIDLNPYAINGKHACIVIVRDEHKGPASGSRGFANWFAGLIAQIPGVEELVVHFLNFWPSLIPSSLNSALDVLRDSKYVDKSYNVMLDGGINREPAWAIEFSVGPENFGECIDKVLEFFPRMSKDNHWWITGPIALRFVQAADAYLAPQYGRATCMIELDMLAGTHHEFDLLSKLEEEILPLADVRIHWGLELDKLKGSQLPSMYPKYSQWLEVYNELNAGGMFNSQLTDRLGISR